MNDPQAHVDEIYRKSEAKAAEKRKEKVLRNAAIVEALQSEGGKIIRAEIQRLKDEWNLPPEGCFMNVADGSQVVNTSLVAKLAGGRESFTVLLTWFANCESFIESEARLLREQEKV